VLVERFAEVGTTTSSSTWHYDQEEGIATSQSLRRADQRRRREEDEEEQRQMEIAQVEAMQRAQEARMKARGLLPSSYVIFFFQPFILILRKLKTFFLISPL